MLSAAELASITATVTGSLDVSLPYYDKTTGLDGYGHSTEAYPTPTSMLACNIINPSATQLQSYAEVIGSQHVLLLRYMPSSNVKEGGRILYNNKKWLVQYILPAESYSVANEALISEVE